MENNVCKKCGNPTWEKISSKKGIGKTYLCHSCGYRVTKLGGS